MNRLGSSGEFKAVGGLSGRQNLVANYEDLRFLQPNGFEGRRYLMVLLSFFRNPLALMDFRDHALGVDLIKEMIRCSSLSYNYDKAMRQHIHV